MKEQLKHIALFLAVAIAAFALVCTCIASFNFASESHQGFYAICGAITLVAGGIAVYKGARYSMQFFLNQK